MPTQLPIRIKDYYDRMPSSSHMPGDIWSGLPTYGLIGTDVLNGIVITPACDLSNRKVETITYLPIIPVRSYFTTSAFLMDILREIGNLLIQLQRDDLFVFLDTNKRFCPPEIDNIELVEDELGKELLNNTHKNKILINRILSGIKIIRQINNPQIIDCNMKDLESVMGERNLTSILKRIVTNSYRLDIYFLPSDEQDSECSGILHQSIALFRYALSAPVEIFEIAQDLNLQDWESALSRLTSFIPGATSFAGERPLKRISLKPRFMADLLTRYVAMHVRLGSPDFTEQAVDSYVSDMRGI